MQHSDRNSPLTDMVSPFNNTSMHVTALALLSLRVTADAFSRPLLGSIEDIFVFSGHVLGIKVFPLCPKYNITQAAPEHVLTCIGCQKNQLLSSSEDVLTKI